MTVQPTNRTIKSGKNYQEKGDGDFMMVPIAGSRKKRGKMKMDSDSDFEAGDDDDDEDYI